MASSVSTPNQGVQGAQPEEGASREMAAQTTTIGRTGPTGGGADAWQRETVALLSLRGPATASQLVAPAGVAATNQPMEPSSLAATNHPIEPPRVATANQPAEPSHVATANQRAAPSDAATTNQPAEPSDAATTNQPAEPSHGATANQPAEPSHVATANQRAAPSDAASTNPPADSRLRRLIRFFDPAEPGCVRRFFRLLVAGFLLFGCLACGGGAVFWRTETGRYLELFLLYHNWLNEPCIERADRLIRDHPTSNWHYYRIKAACLRRLGRFEESLAVYDEAIRALPDNWWPYSHRCYYRGLLDDPHEVLADCDRSIELAPDDMVVALDRRAMIRALVGDREGAIADFEEALELSERRVRGAYSSELRAIREQWLERLREGDNPLTEEAIWADLAAYGTPRQ